MKFKVFIVSILFVYSLLKGISLAQNKVVVIPLIETSTDTPAPVPKTGQTATFAVGYNGKTSLIMIWAAWLCTAWPPWTKALRQDTLCHLIFSAQEPETSGAV